MCRTARPPRTARETRPKASGCSAPSCASSTGTPSRRVDEQAAIYGEVLEAFAGHKVVVRTLDAGSDKPLKFAGHPEEANPALGVRGIRIADGQPALLRAPARARSPPRRRPRVSQPRVMAPMIATAAEANALRAKGASRGARQPA